MTAPSVGVDDLADRYSETRAPDKEDIAWLQRVFLFEIGNGHCGESTSDMIDRQRARARSRRIMNALASPVSGDGSSADADTHRASEGTVVGPYRVRETTDRWLVERELPCINGLSAWSAICSTVEPSAEEYGYTDGACGSGEDNARAIANALNAASVSPCMETLQASECTKHGEGDQ